MPMVKIDQIKAFSDVRGVVYEPLQSHELATQKNVHVALTEPGCIRGNHYHTRGIEILAVCGPALVRFRDENTIRDVEVPEGIVFRFVFPPGITHAIKNTGARPAAVIAFSSQEHDPANLDLVRDVIMAS